MSPQFQAVEGHEAKVGIRIELTANIEIEG